MSKFVNIDDWEPVDMASTGMGVAAGLGAPLMAGFSIFMMGEAAGPAYDEDGKDRPPAPPVKKSAAKGKDIMMGMGAPKPGWA